MTLGVLWIVSGGQSNGRLSSLSPPVAQGAFQAAEGGVDEAVALVVGAAGAHPAQAGVVEEAEVAPQGEVVAVAPAAADHLGQCRHRRLPRLPSHLSCTGWGGLCFRVGFFVGMVGVGWSFWGTKVAVGSGG